MKITLIAGGWSDEREVSLAGAERIAQSLKRLGHSVAHFDPQTSLCALPEALRGQDFAFINLHGSPGEDGLVQAMLTALNIPFQGSAAGPSQLALNKAASKALFRANGLLTPDWIFLPLHRDAEADHITPPLPVFVKANTGGSSLRVMRVMRMADMAGALSLLGSRSDLLVERAVAGMEVTCGVLDAEALPPVLIRPRQPGAKFFDYGSKYACGGAEELCPAPLPAQLTTELQHIALRAHRLLGLSGYSRADFIVDADERPWLLEINTLPGMTATSLVPREAAAVGIDFDGLVERLVAAGLKAWHNGLSGCSRA